MVSMLPFIPAFWWLGGSTLRGSKTFFHIFFFVGCFFGNYFKKMNKFQEGKVELRF